MAGAALRRLMAEYKQLVTNPPEGIVAGPVSEDNFFEWEALITGPEGTCFEGGVFPAKLIFPVDYPLSPPKMQFTCDMFHPNVYPDGRVCISILHAPGDDPMGYETSAERWSPVQSVEKILLSVVSILAEPNDESGANVDAAKMWRENQEEFKKISEKLVPAGFFRLSYKSTLVTSIAILPFEAYLVKRTLGKNKNIFVQVAELKGEYPSCQSVVKGEYPPCQYFDKVVIF